jgi:AcrR family transcriptional regulator
MEEILKNMGEEKRNRIINSALEEFSKNSFEKASTNNIVKKAGIS